VRAWKRWRWVGVMALMLAVPAQGAGVKAPKIEPADVEALVQVGRLVLSGKVKSVRDIPDGIVTPALIKAYDEKVSIVLFRDRAPLTRYSFAGKNLLDDMLGMTLRATMMPGHRFYGFDESEEVGFFIEWTTSRESVKPVDWRKKLSLLALGVEGLEVEGERLVVAQEPGKDDPKKPVKREKRKVADILFPSWAVMGELASRDDFIFRLCESLKLYPSKRPVMPTGSVLWDDKTTKVSLIKTRSFVVLPGALKAQELFRVNTPPEIPDVNGLAGMANVAAKFMCQGQGPDGAFCLSYRPTTGELASSYDMVTHGLGVEALLDLYERTKDKRCLTSAVRGLEYALSKTRVETKDEKPRRFVVYNDQANLGYTALTAANLVRLTQLAPTEKVGKYDVAATITELAQFVMDMQYDDGSFRYSHRYDPAVPFHYTTRPADADMAAWALLCVGDLGKNAACMDRAKLAVEFLISKREAGMNWKEAPAFTWLARTLRKRYLRDQDKPCATYLFRMADAVLADQYKPDSEQGPDVAGAYAANVQQLVTATACKMVVVNEAALLARTMGDDARAQRYSKSVRLASGFLASNRFRPENSFYLPDPDGVQGDFRAGIFRSTITLETEAFAIEALLTLEEILKLEAK